MKPRRNTAPSAQALQHRGKSQIDFSGRTKQFVVELRAEEERRGAQSIEFWTNRLEKARALRRNQRTESANHIEAGGLSRAPCRKVVGNDPVGLSSMASANASRSPSPRRRRKTGADGMALGAWILAQIGRIGIEGAISRATAGGIRTDSKMPARRSSR